MFSWINLKMNALDFARFEKRYGSDGVGVFIGEDYVYLIPDLVVDDAKED
jgi:hypothetical protein